MRILILILKIMPKTIKWLPQEDEILISFIGQQNSNTTSKNGIPWTKLSWQLRTLLNSDKTPKQCQTRWNYSLRPGRKSTSVLSQAEENIIFDMQRENGNKWTLIASQLNGKHQNGVKNFFYSTLRKSIRIINAHMAANRQHSLFKNRKPFNQNCITKIVSQEQGKGSKMRVSRSNIGSLAKEIQNLLILVYRDPKNSQLIQQTVELLRDFNKNCRRVKQKNSHIKYQIQLSENEEKEKAVRSNVKKSKMEIEVKIQKREQSIDQEEDGQREFQHFKIEAQEYPLNVCPPPFWTENQIKYEPEHVCIIERQQVQKKNQKNLVKTRDIDNQEEAEKVKEQNQDMDQKEEVFINFEQNLSLDGLLNLPSFEMEPRIIESSMDDECSSQREYIFNQYFN